MKKKQQVEEEVKEKQQVEQEVKKKQQVEEEVKEEAAGRTGGEEEAAGRTGGEEEAAGRRGGERRSSRSPKNPQQKIIKRVIGLEGDFISPGGMSFTSPEVDVNLNLSVSGLIGRELHCITLVSNWTHWHHLVVKVTHCGS
ncbi:unnamed protein product [Pleuronectes platessa]|uniref:Uncharacterized protein n=1 Tax=Pleuronectes platessa TaxID=8262 RepID=A0A9N7YP91_PLEPL|nr:unnamed protein product [Pleuronectes platessa]